MDTPLDLPAILEKHSRWLRNEDGGKRADLFGAILRGANLRGANLRGANLRGADLSGAIGIFSAGPVGSEGRLIYAVAGHGTADDGLIWQAGCFWGTTADLISAIGRKYQSDPRKAGYLAAVAAGVAVLGRGAPGP